MSDVDTPSKPLTADDLRETMRYLRDTKPQPVDYPRGTFDDYMRFAKRLEAEFGEKPTEVSE